MFIIENTTADDGHTVYCSNTTDKWIDAILLYSGKRLDTDITIFAVCKYLTYVPPMLSANNMVELCEIEIGGKCLHMLQCIYVYYITTFFLKCVFSIEGKQFCKQFRMYANLKN